MAGSFGEKPPSVRKAVVAGDTDALKNMQKHAAESRRRNHDEQLLREQDTIAEITDDEQRTRRARLEDRGDPNGDYEDEDEQSDPRKLAQLIVAMRARQDKIERSLKKKH